MNTKVAIVGNGVWGNALYSVVSQQIKDIDIIKRGEQIFSDVVIIATPTSSIRDVLTHINFLEKKIIVNSSKGIEGSTHFLPHQLIEEKYGNSVDYFTLMGPSFAEEVTLKMPTLVNLGVQNNVRSTKFVQSLFQTSYFQVRVSKGVEALEVAGALKNVYAIAAGIVEGLGFRVNTKAQLIVLAIEELQRLYKGMKIHFDPNITPELIGDLILTCGPGSRNFNFGKLLVTRTITDALKQIGSTVEGHNTISSVAYLEKKGKSSLPVAHLVKDVIESNNPHKVIQHFSNLLNST